VTQLERIVAASSTRIVETPARHLERSEQLVVSAVTTARIDLSVLDAALDYRARGFLPLPLRGKKPAADLIRRTHGSTRTSKLVEDGVTDEQLEIWFSNPDLNVGIFCGEPSHGLVVVDVDDPTVLGREVFASTPTPVVATSRGYHLYFRADASRPVENQKLEWGEVSARAPRYVVATPSRHASGARYRWEHSLDELPLADFADVRLPERTSENKRTKNNIRPTKAVLLWQCPTRDRGKDGWVRSFDRDPHAVEAMAKALRIEAPLGKPFRCILHEEKNASAVLAEAAESGEWLYRDFHGPARGGPEWLSLAQVRAQLSGRGPKLSGPEHATWKLVLLDEAGVLPCQAVAADRLPDDVNGIVAHVYERFLYLLGCRWNYDYGDPAPFERNFAAAFCNVPVREARFAIDELKRLEQLVVVGRHGRARLWLPAGVVRDRKTK
jgi:hypothetical protein